MNRWQAFNVLCAYLRSGLLGEEPRQLHEFISWELLIEASSHHYVTPALAWCLKDNTAVPIDFRNYFDAVLALNARRNEALLDGLALIVGALNAIDIEPVLLKGAARLVEAVYPSPILRFLGDLDVLIPAERSASAVAALQSTGFSARSEDKIFPPPHHHLQMLHERETGVGVELHTDVIGGAGAAVISTGWFYKGTSRFPFRGLQIRLPDATRSVGHNVIHDQIHHSRYARRRVELRQLLDLTLIRRARENEIDWVELDERFCALELGEALATYLKFAETLLGQPAPKFRCAPRAGALTDFRRIIEPPQVWQRPATILFDYVARLRRDPHIAINLFDLRSWPSRSRNLLKRKAASW